MELFLPLLALAIIAAILAVFLKESRLPALAVVIAMVAGIIILLQLLPRLLQTVDVFRQLAERVN